MKHTLTAIVITALTLACPALSYAEISAAPEASAKENLAGRNTMVMPEAPAAAAPSEIAKTGGQATASVERSNEDDLGDLDAPDPGSDPSADERIDD